MKKTGSLLVVAVAVSLMVVFAAGPCAAQQQAGTPTAPQKAESVQKAMIKGKIAYVKSMGYHIKGEEPAHEFVITNQNPKVLKKLMKSGKTVTFEGHYDMGADRIFIETIDGKKYRGK